MEVGRALRRRRETLGYTLEDVRAATKIRLRYLQALEDERFDDLPAPVYTRGFIRSYGNFLDLDGAALAAAWAEAAAPAVSDETPPDEAAPGGDVQPPASRAEAPEPSRALGAPSAAGRLEVSLQRRPAPRPPGRRRLPILVLWLVALIAIVAAAYALQASSRGPSAGPQAAATSSASAPASASATGTATAPAATATAPPAPSLTASTSVDSAGNALTTYHVAGAASLTVVATASARCWVRVWLDGSTTYADQTLAAGQSATWRAQRQVRLRIGYPPGLHLTVDGLAVPAFRSVNPVDAALILAAQAP